VKPLTDTQKRAAVMLGRGHPVEEVAAEVGRSRRTVSDWRRREDFREVERGARSQAINDAPTMRAVLEMVAHEAVRPDGSIDYATRAGAARALIGADGFGAPPEPPPPEPEIYDDALGGPEPQAVPPDLRRLYDEWGGAEVTQREADHWRAALDHGWAGVDAGALAEMAAA
jgi:hypothetical protein